MNKQPRGRPKIYTPETLKTTTPPRNGTYYTVPEVVEILNIHRHTVQALLRDGTLQGKIIGGRWRIYKEALYTEERKQDV